MTKHETFHSGPERESGRETNLYGDYEQFHDKPFQGEYPPSTEVQEYEARMAIEAVYAKTFERTLVNSYHSLATVDVPERTGRGVERGRHVVDNQLAPAQFWNSLRLADAYANATDARDAPVESVAFTPVTEAVHVRAQKQSGIRARMRALRTKLGFSGKRRANGADSEIMHTSHKPIEIKNAETGEMEQAVHVDYMFDGSNFAHLPNAPTYVENQSPRRSYMAVRMQLPQSVAGELYARTLENPDVMRQVAEEAVLRQYEAHPDRLTAGEWKGSDENSPLAKSRPPYEALDPEWTMSVFVPDVTPYDYDAQHPKLEQMQQYVIEHAAPARLFNR